VLKQFSASDTGQKAMAEGRRLVTFALVGAGAFVIDAGLLALLLGAGLERVPARALSLFAGMSFAFALNRAFTFAEFRGQSLPRQFALYLLANLTGAAVNYVVFLALTAKGAWLADAPFIAVGVGAVAGMGFNFTASRLTAFRH
jgi:putative flippase GtrA